MRIGFGDDELRRLYEDPNFHAPRYGTDLVKAIRKKIGIIVAAATEQDLRSMKSLHFEKLVGDRAGQHSIRLNDQWRLVFRLETGDDGRVVVILEVVDYH
jgi:proteic killer suppression protein